MAAVHRLPPELLSEVFLILRAITRRDPVTGEIEYGFSPNWIHAATWTCRRWREVALETQTLWTWFHTRHRVLHPEAVRTFIERAPDTEILDVVVNTTPHGDQDSAIEGADRVNVFEHLQPWIDRIDMSLWVMVDGPDVSPCGNVSGLVGAMGPAVWSLSLTTGMSNGEGIDDPFTLDVEGLPYLRDLCLSCLPSGDTPLSGIPSITLHTVKGWKAARRLQEFLAMCPDVEQLFIYGSLPESFAEEAPLALPQIHLSQMTNLIVNGAAIKPAANMLATFRLPPEASFEFSLDEKDAESPAVPSLLQHDAWLRDVLLPGDLNNLPVVSDTHTLAVRLQHQSADGEWHAEPEEPSAETPLWFVVGGKPEVLPSGIYGPHWTIQGFLHGGVPIMTRPRCLSRFMHGLPLIVRPALVTRMHIHFEDWLSSALRRKYLWRELFGAFPALRTLVVGGWECIKAAARTLEADPALLPHLKALVLCISGSPAHVQGGMAIVRWLQARCAAGTDLELLEMGVGASVPLETVALLRRLRNAAKMAQPTLEIQWHTRQLCDECHWTFLDEPEPVPETVDRDWEKHMDTEDGWEWPEPDGESGWTDFETDEGVDGDE